VSFYWGHPIKGAPNIGKKGKGFPYSPPSVGPGADPSVQAVSPQVTISHPPGGRLPLIFARPAVTFPAAEHHRLLAGTNYHIELKNRSCGWPVPSYTAW